MLFESLQKGDYFICLMHFRTYKKISNYFALDTLHGEIFQFTGKEIVYKED